jgi:hypothetical protein
MALRAAALDEDAMLGSAWGRLSACAGLSGPPMPVRHCVFGGVPHGPGGPPKVMKMGGG